MKLALGTVQFSFDYGISNQTGQPSIEVARKILETAVQSGIAYYDTAYSYPHAESIIGEGLLFDKARIVTKTPHFKGGEPKKQFHLAFNQSLKDLHRDSVYALLVHDVTDLLGSYGEQLWTQMQQVKQEGRSKKIGVSLYSVEQLEMLFDSYEFDIVQLPLNIFNQSFLYSGWLNKLKAKGVEIHARSVFLQGLLLMNPLLLDEKLPVAKPYVMRFQQKCANLGVSPLSAAINYVYQQPEVDRVVIGVNKVRELTEIMTAIDSNFDASIFIRDMVEDEHVTNSTLW